MEKEKFTPGPWKYDGEYVWADAISGYVANPQTEDMTSGICIARKDANKAIKANGHLIAAAPDMLEALKAVIPILEYNSQLEELHGLTSGHKKTLIKVEAAIAKAEGEQP